MRPTRKCEFCGKTFVPRSGMQKYCSEECQAEAKRLRKKRQQDLINGIEPIMDLQHQEYLTFSKAAVLMGCSRQYVYKLVNQDKLKASRISSRMAIIRCTDIVFITDRLCTVEKDYLIAYLDMLAFLKEVMQTYTRNSAVSP